MNTIIHLIEKENNSIYIKREDLIPFSFGGNKARKAALFFDEIDKGSFDTVVTYGSSSSNHSRVVSNMAFQKGMECHIISPEESSYETYNSKLMKKMRANIISVPVESVSKTISLKMESLQNEGKRPFFIPGGGHGNIGTQAYVDCFQEILKYEEENKIKFDYIFLASGTGTTHAGLVCGNLINDRKMKILGISIARKNPFGRKVIIDSIKEYLESKKLNFDEKYIQDSTVFLDDYIAGGYGKYDEDIVETVNDNIRKYGIPFDLTYTGKAYNGMKKYIKQNDLKNKNILFIHTGGTPLFFDFLNND